MEFAGANPKGIWSNIFFIIDDSVQCDCPTSYGIFRFEIFLPMQKSHKKNLHWKKERPTSEICIYVCAEEHGNMNIVSTFEHTRITTPATTTQKRERTFY